MRRHPFASFCALAALAGCNPDNMEPNPARNPINPPLPTSTLTSTSDTVPALADALIRTSSRHSNHGGAQTMMVKITQSQDDSTRVVISFDQAAIAAAIGSGTLTRATLELGIEQSALSLGTGSTPTGSSCPGPSPASPGAAAPTSIWPTPAQIAPPQSGV